MQPIQYIIKLGADSARGEGIELLDDKEIKYMSDLYGKKGEKCG